MPDLFQFNKEMEEYLHTLPENLQEYIRKSNQRLGCKADLVQYAEQLSSGKRTEFKM